MGVEGDYQAGLIQCAELTGWRAYHVANVHGQLRSRTGEGFQDLNLVHGERALIVYAEIKRLPSTSKAKKAHPTDAQKAWAEAVALAARFCPDRVFSVLWRPEHYDEALRFLSGGTDTPPGIVKPNLSRREWS